jgi:hypothetical protein
MNNTLFTIYWTNSGYAWSEDSYDMKYALKRMEDLRNTPGCRAITMCAENPDQVGKMGVDKVEGLTLPDGQEYVYKTGRDRGR